MPNYEVFVDGVSEGGFQALTSSGSSVIAAGGSFIVGNATAIQRPNVTPALDAVYAPLKGVAAGDYRDPWVYLPAYPAMTDVRIFIRKAQLRIRWDDGAGGLTPISGRWVGGGVDWSGPATYLSGRLQNALSPTKWFHFLGEKPPFDPKDPLGLNRNRASGIYDYGLTDDTGICTAYFCVGIAIGYPNFSFSATIWDLFYPGLPAGLLRDPSEPQVDDPAEAGFGDIGFLLFARQKQQALYLSEHYITTAGYAMMKFPYAGDEAHYSRQLTPDLDADGGNGWGVNYTTDWVSGTGMLAMAPAPIADHDYRQGINVELKDNAGAPVAGAAVTFGPFSGTTGVDGKVTIDAVPLGSWLVPQTTKSVDPFTSLELEDASGYASASPPSPHLVPPHTTAGEIGVTYTGKSGNTLTGVKAGTPAGPGSPSTVLTGLDVDGGEVATLPYADFHIEKAGVVYADTSLYIYEDEYVEWGGRTDGDGDPDQTIDGDGLDYAQDPFGEPYLTESREPEVIEWTGLEMERDFGQKKALSETLKCPSQVILADHRRLLLGIVDGAARLWTTDDAYETDQTGGSVLLSDDRTWTKGLLRLDPDGNTVKAWLTDDAGQVYVSESPDGGETWGTPASAVTLTAGRQERGDVRHDGSSWLRAHPEGTALKLYSSPDGEEWTDEGEISADGNFPWLLCLPDGSLGCLYHDGAGVVFRSGTEDAGGWTWADPVSVATVDPTGPAGFANGQKLLAAYRTSKTEVGFSVSFDGGETWQEGSEG